MLNIIKIQLYDISLSTPFATNVKKIYTCGYTTFDNKTFIFSVDFKTSTLFEINTPITEMIKYDQDIAYMTF